MKLSDVKVGDTLVADGGFTCIDEGTELIVGDGLFVECSKGKHFLDGQVDFADGETIIGLKFKETEE